jgi:chorismate mutase/prephenate dehydratase
MSIEDLRHKIDEIDNEVLRLLSRRAECAQQIGHGKEKTATRFFAPERERLIFERLRDLNGGPLPHAAVQAIFREIISASRALEAPVKVSYLGPAGTFSHRAALGRFGTSSELKPVDTIPDVFTEVERGAADYGVVPVENSTEGVVPYTLDMFSRTALKVCAEVFVPVHHHLATRAESLKAVKRLYSHPQSSAQSRAWLRENLAKVEIVEVSSNSKSAQMAAVDSEGAAITTDIAAELYKVPVVAQHIEDSPHNRTRFLVIGQNEPKPSGKDKTSIFFSVQHKAGALLRALAAFDAHGLNLTMIESRPTKQMPWEYVFFIDFQGHRSEERVAHALKMLEEQGMVVSVMVSYPRGRVGVGGARGRSSRATADKDGGAPRRLRRCGRVRGAGKPSGVPRRPGALRSCCRRRRAGRCGCTAARQLLNRRRPGTGRGAGASGAARCA